jgi:hypothetical protein
MKISLAVVRGYWEKGRNKAIRRINYSPKR